MRIIPDGSDLNGVVHPKDIKHIKYIRFWLNIISAWPNKAIGESNTKFTMPFRYYNVALTSTCFCLFLTFVYRHIRILSFFELGQTYIALFMSGVYTGREWFILTKKYEVITGKFINEIHLFHHKHVSEYAMKIHMSIHKLSHVFSLYTIISMMWGLSFFNLIPLYSNITAIGFSGHNPQNITYEQSIYISVPFDYTHEFKGYLVICIFDWYLSITCSISFCVMDLLLTVKVFHLWGHIKILIHNLKNLPIVKVNKTEADVKEETRLIKDIVIHHNLILGFRNEISDAFGPNIAIYYMFHQISTCVLMLECSNLEPKALLRFGPLTLIMLQLQIQMSVIFELLSSLTDKLFEAAYNTPWEHMHISSQKSILFILSQTQRPLGLKAMGMVEVGMKTSVAILKTSLSYFIMLKTVTN